MGEAERAARAMSDQTEAIRERVRAAFESGTALCIEGGGSKRFFGREPRGEPLAMDRHRGIVNHVPSELVLTVRAGTAVREVEAALATEGQWLAFEPPRHDDNATIGGVVACALSGPARPWTGAVRDFILGVRIIDGRGDVLSFGGEVMKNVAGYDVSRLMAGALGTLGVLLEVSFRLLPQPPHTRTLSFDWPADEAVRHCVEWGRTSLPLSGACHDGERLRVRLSGPEPVVAEAARALGGEEDADGTGFWDGLRDQRLAFFDSADDGAPLWRFAVAPHAPPFDVPGVEGPVLIDWGGAQRWARTGAPAAELHALAADAGGHATRFRGGDRSHSFQELPDALRELHARLKTTFDPGAILNPGRMYEDF